MKALKEIICDMPPYKGTEYRVVCKFGYMPIYGHGWWHFLQKKVTFKKWLLFGPLVGIWIEVDKGVYYNTPDSVSHVKARSKSLYENTVLSYDKWIQRNIDIK